MKENISGICNYCLKSAYERVIDKVTSNKSIAPLLMRLFFGYFWLQTGYYKLLNVTSFQERFVDWGIPFPELSAYLSGLTDFVGGACLILGLGTRLVALPMAFNMIVAISLVVIKNVGNLNEFSELDEALYILIFFWFFMNGAGKYSLDYLFKRKVSCSSIK